jgi:hypothetical protein
MNLKIYPIRLPLSTLSVFSRKWSIPEDLSDIAQRNIAKLSFRLEFQNKSSTVKYVKIGQTSKGTLLMVVRLQRIFFLAGACYCLAQLRFKFNGTQESVLIIELFSVVELWGMYFWQSSFFAINAEKEKHPAL